MAASLSPSPRQALGLLSFDDSDDYVSEDGSTELHHRDGLPWWKASTPPRRHQCWAQTEGWIRFVERVERCACGAIRLDGPHGVWMERNSRRLSPNAETTSAASAPLRCSPLIYSPLRWLQGLSRR